MVECLLTNYVIVGLNTAAVTYSIVFNLANQFYGDLRG